MFQLHEGCIKWNTNIIDSGIVIVQDLSTISEILNRTIWTDPWKTTCWILFARVPLLGSHFEGPKAGTWTQFNRGLFKKPSPRLFLDTTFVTSFQSTMLIWDDLGDGFKYFVFFAPVRGEMLQFDWYFWIGMTPPTGDTIFEYFSNMVWRI